MGNFLERFPKWWKPVGTKPADEAGTSTRPSTSQIPQTSGVTSREEVGTQPADDAGTSTRPSTSCYTQRSGASIESIGTIGGSQIPIIVGSSRVDVTYQVPATPITSGNGTRAWTKADIFGLVIVVLAVLGVIVAIGFTPKSGANIGTISGSHNPVIVGSGEVHFNYHSPPEVPGSGPQPSTAHEQIKVSPQNAGTGTWDLSSCQEQLKKTYNTRYHFSKHPTSSTDPLYHVNVDELYTELLLCQDDYTEVLKETLGKIQIDKAETKPLESFKDLLNAEKIKELLIILSGGAGYGKSTVFKKIVNTWAKRDLFSNFRLLFFLELKLMNTRCVIDEILNQCFPQDKRPGRDDLIRIITDNEKESVFVLDGLDELRPALLEPKENTENDKFCLYNVLHNKVLRDSRVLVATRPHMVARLQKDNQKYALVHTEGFTAENTDQYIRKHFTDDRKTEADGLIKCLREKQMLRNMARNPLLCQIMCLVFSNDGKLSDRLTPLYNSFTKVLAMRRCQENENWKKRLDSELRNLGKVAFDALIDGENQLVLEFSGRESVLDTGASGESGFIQLESYTSGFDRKTIVTFLHKTFQEYSAAYYFAHLHDESKEEFHERLKQINPDNVDAMEYLLRFACGISSGSPATALILEHVQKQHKEPERRDTITLQNLARHLLFESDSDELADKLDRPTVAHCLSQDNLLAMRYYLQSLPQPPVELQNLTVTCRSREELALLTGIDRLLHDDTTVDIDLHITGRLHEWLKLLGEILLGEILLIGDIRSISRFHVSLAYFVSEKTDEETETPVEVDTRIHDRIPLTLVIYEKSRLDERVLGSLSRVCKPIITDVLVSRKTYDDVISLAKALTGCDRLHSVDVSETNLHGHLAGVAPLVPPSLRELSLWNCTLNDDDVPDLISILPAWHGLRWLNVEDNAFSEVGVETLTAHLRNLPELKAFWLE